MKAAKEHVCIRCKVDPPKTSRATDIEKHPRTPMCATHRREWRAEQREARHEKHVAKTYGLEPGEYDKLYAAQGGKCWFPNCTATGKTRKLTVDHDHATGEVRGLVCKGHNYYLLGWYQNDLQLALDYQADPPYRRWKEGRDLWSGQ